MIGQWNWIIGLLINSKQFADFFWHLNWKPMAVLCDAPRSDGNLMESGGLRRHSSVSHAKIGNHSLYWNAHLCIGDALSARFRRFHGSANGDLPLVAS